MQSTAKKKLERFCRDLFIRSIQFLFELDLRTLRIAGVNYSKMIAFNAGKVVQRSWYKRITFTDLIHIDASG